MQVNTQFLKILRASVKMWCGWQSYEQVVSDECEPCSVGQVKGMGENPKEASWCYSQTWYVSWMVSAFTFVFHHFFMRGETGLDSAKTTVVLWWVWRDTPRRNVFRCAIPVVNSLKCNWAMVQSASSTPKLINGERVLEPVKKIKHRRKPKNTLNWVKFFSSY